MATATARQRKQRTLSERVQDKQQRVALAKAELELKQLRAQKKAADIRMAALSTYQAASKQRTFRDWRAPDVSADAAIVNDSQTLIARARQMMRDDPYAQSIGRSFVRNVVGKGIHPTATACDLDGKPLEVFNKRANAEWYDWSRKKKLVDRERRRNIVKIQQWIVRELVAVGEALVIMSYEERARGCGLVLQCVEAEQLDPYLFSGEDGRDVRGGVEVDEYGAPVAYHILTRHPNDLMGAGVDRWHRPDIRTPDSPDLRDSTEKAREVFGLQSIRVPAERVLHIYDPERVRQTRGVSRLAAALVKLRDLGEFDYATLLKARAESCLGLVITTNGSTGGIGLEDPTNPDGKDADGNDELAAQPLMVARLQKGEEVSTFTPATPGNTYEPFLKAQLRAIAAATGVSYEQVARDFTGGTYSSQRQGMLEDRREFEPLQELVINEFCIPVWEEFIHLRWLEGKLPAMGLAKNPELYQYATWRGQGWPWVDPEKEAKGVKLLMELGLTAPQIEALTRGHDFGELAHLNALAEAIRAKARKAAGLDTTNVIEPDTKPEPAAPDASDAGDVVEEEATETEAVPA